MILTEHQLRGRLVGKVKKKIIYRTATLYFSVLIFTIRYIVKQDGHLMNSSILHQLQLFLIVCLGAVIH